jgi:hypothetical protein
VIITVCAAMQGDSGAPLLILGNGALKVVGVLSAIAASKAGLQSVSVPASTVIAALRTKTEK